jgi:FMN reductase
MRQTAIFIGPDPSFVEVAAYLSQDRLSSREARKDTKMKSAAPLILGIGGTTRAGSTSEKALRFALARAAAAGCRTEIIAGPEMPVEHYDPGKPERSASAARLVSLMREASGIIIASPGYHGSVSGLVKNALDYTEDLRTDSRVYFDGIAMGCIAVADGPQALGSTVAAMRSVAHALRAWPTPYAAMINSTTKPFDEAGQPNEITVANGLATVAEQVVTFALMRKAFLSQTSVAA